jgi:RecB family endonuclease NucS
MYFGGYATIHKYDKGTNGLYLKIPNKSINKYLVRDYLKSKFSTSDITEFERVAKKVHNIMTVTPTNEMGSKIGEIKKLFDNVLNHYTYEGMTSEGEFRNIMDSILKIGFNDVALEIQTKNGRIDTVITENSRIFIIEYKYNATAFSALEQIKEKEYYAHYLSTNLPILLFGISLRKKNKSKTRYIEISYVVYESKVLHIGRAQTLGGWRAS